MSVPTWSAGKPALSSESSLSELYPVISDPERKAGIGSAVPSRIILTEEGRKSLLTKLDDNDISNERIWRTLLDSTRSRNTS